MEHNKPVIADLGLSREQKMAKKMDNLMATMADPRMQEWQAQATQQAYAQPHVQAQIQAMMGANPQMQAMMGGIPQTVVDAKPIEAGQADAADRILKLKSLLDAGAISQEEYDQKKVELLTQV
eukprot:CAMPEP_0174719108 /NCGR_PEP_ID=MMETSP1094-20130205/30794_1 /TAXON_ID=156173 /ORGANISM="Chrysochromulina brevifilum, Strain UTEX LB 985" /LENGTH=122 /DNA_ID=CAMNT_0015919371 /DNA_START=111 /DNA_END=479 /DNA_ORIENTATION=-